MTSCFLLAQDSSLYLRVHSGEKLFKCDQCSYLSTRAWNLKLHKLNHTGETPYKCGQCHYPTVCGQNANERLAYCPDFYCGWHFVRPNFWLAFCLDHLNMFWHFVTIMKITFQITFHKKAKSISKTGSDEGKLSQLLRTLCKEKEVDTMR